MGVYLPDAYNICCDSDDRVYKIGEYCFYGNLNLWLRKGINKSKTKKIAEILTKALKKLPKYNGTAYRAIELNGEALASFLKLHKKGSKVVYKEFVSCGSNIKAAFFDKARKNVFLKMEVKNAPIISSFADGIKFRGYAKDELLLFRGRQFIVKNIEQIGEKYLITLKQI